MSSNVQHKPRTASEQKELQRVFDQLANFLSKKDLYIELRPLEERKGRLGLHLKNPLAIKIYSSDGQTLTESAVQHELETVTAQVAELQGRIDEFDRNPSKKIRAPDLNEALRGLGHRCTRKEIEDMIWEVDENMDGSVDWNEFQLMFERNITDTTGLEPFQLFNVVQFMMYDKDCSGNVSVDETMHMLYSRYGKANLESQMKALFGDDLKTADGDGELSFNEYLKAVNVRIPNQKTEKRKNKKGGTTL